MTVSPKWFTRQLYYLNSIENIFKNLFKQAILVEYIGYY